MITKEQWADKALHVARFGTSASSGEHAAWEGLPLLRKALNALSALDPNHRQGVVDIVLAWQSDYHQQFWEILQAMRTAHAEETERQKMIE
jgi:hypothetical protein